MRKSKKALGALGVASGLFGASAFMSIDGEKIRSLRMPSFSRYGAHPEIDVRSLVASIRSIEAEHEIRLIVMEKFAMGRARPSKVTPLEWDRRIHQYGLILGVMKTLGPPVELVKPFVWCRCRSSTSTWYEQDGEHHGDRPIKGFTFARSSVDQHHELFKAIHLAELGRGFLMNLSNNPGFRSEYGYPKSPEAASLPWTVVDPESASRRRLECPTEYPWD